MLAPYPNPDTSVADSGCLVIVDDRHVMLAGGRVGEDGSASERAFMFEVTTPHLSGDISGENSGENSGDDSGEDAWRELPAMPAGKVGHSCGVVNTTDGMEVVVAGGEDDKTVAIFNVETEIWRQGMYQICIRGCQFPSTLHVTYGVTQLH